MRVTVTFLVDRAPRLAGAASEEVPAMRRLIAAGFASVLVAGLVPTLTAATPSAGAPAPAPDAAEPGGPAPGGPAGPKYQVLVLASADQSTAEKDGLKELQKEGKK